MTFLELQNNFAIKYEKKITFNDLIFHLSKKVKNATDLILYRNELIDFSFKLFEKYYDLHFNKQVPISYITNSVEFCGYNFYVDNRVLIPRKDTEVVVQTFIKFIKQTNFCKKNILDLCTGSGCIALVLGKEFKDNLIFGSDIDKKALSVAEINKKKINSNNVIFVQADFLKCLTKINKQIDYLICNPPYISYNSSEVDFDVSLYEPKHALYADNNGLKFYLDFVQYLIHNQWKPAICCFEFGHNQKKVIEKIISKLSFLYKIFFFEDNNHLPRGFILLKKQK